MEFFDQKQEVVDIQLTPHGKHLLSKGKWRPKFYAFFDRDITYDVEYSGYAENQKDTSDRIKSAVRPKPQAITYGIESHFERVTQEYDVSEQQGTWTPPADLTFASVNPPPPNLNLKDLDNPLGNSNLNSSYYPSFAANFFAGNISSSFDNYTGSLGQPEQIPQINCKVNFITKVKSGGVVFDSNEEGASTEFGPDVIEPGLADEPEEDRLYSPEVYKDGTYVTIQAKQLLFDIIEKHIPLEKEDFDLEVFRVDTVSMNEGRASSYEYENLKRMKFIRDDLGEQLINYGDVIYNRQTKETFAINHNYVEYYFDLRTDNEIGTPINIPANIVEQPPNPEEPCADE